jgi:hypothetical protein
MKGEVVGKIETTFTLTPTKKPSKSNPIILRRNKLLNGINKQIQNVNDLKKGIKVKNLWWFNDEDNNFYLIVKYGKTELELSKGKFSIMCKNIDEVSDNLIKLKDLVTSGHFDIHLTNLSKTIRSNFRTTSTTT